MKEELKALDEGFEKIVSKMTLEIEEICERDGKIILNEELLEAVKKIVDIRAKLKTIYGETKSDVVAPKGRTIPKP